MIKHEPHAAALAVDVKHASVNVDVGLHAGRDAERQQVVVRLLDAVKLNCASWQARVTRWHVNVRVYAQLSQRNRHAVSAVRKLYACALHNALKLENVAVAATIPA